MTDIDSQQADFNQRADRLQLVGSNSQDLASDGNDASEIDSDTADVFTPGCLLDCNNPKESSPFGFAVLSGESCTDFGALVEFDTAEPVNINGQTYYVNSCKPAAVVHMVDCTEVCRSLYQAQHLGGLYPQHVTGQCVRVPRFCGDGSPLPPLDSALCQCFANGWPFYPGERSLAR